MICIKYKHYDGERNGNTFKGKATPHPTLIGGVNPRVKIAGIIHIEEKKTAPYNHMNGHFKSNIKSMKYADEAFGKLPKEIFVKDFNGGKK